MFGILAKIFGSPSVIKEGIRLIDDMHVTETEAVETRAKAKVDLLQSYAPFKIAQRYLALMFGATFLFSYVLVLGMTITGQGDPDAVTKVMEQFSINWAMMIILTFYFGGGVIDSVKAKNKGS